MRSISCASWLQVRPALLQLPFDAVDEVRIAVDEAGILLLDSSPDADALQLEIATSDESCCRSRWQRMSPRPNGRDRATASWSWTVIQGLTVNPRFVSGDDGRPAIRFRTRSPMKTP